jgi:hypothetical protein
MKENSVVPLSVEDARHGKEDDPIYYILTPHPPTT